MSRIKQHLHQQQQFNDELATEYTADQQFVLNDIANEQEQLMQELMAEEVSGDADYHEACREQAMGEKHDEPGTSEEAPSEPQSDVPF